MPPRQVPASTTTPTTTETPTQKSTPTPRSRKRAQSVQPQLSDSPWTGDAPATPTPSKVRKPKKKKDTPAVELAVVEPATEPITPISTRRSLSDSGSPVGFFIDPTIAFMPSMQENVLASVLMPPPPIPSPTKENIPMATQHQILPVGGGSTMEPVSPIPQSKRRRVDEMETAIPDATQQQQAYAHGVSALNSALMQIQTPNPVTAGNQMQLQKASLNGGDYPGSRIHTLRIITYDMHIVSYTKNIIIQQPFANGQRPSLGYVRQQLQRRWDTKYEGSPNCFDYIDLGLLNTMESYKRMAFRAASAPNGSGIVERGGPVKMMQIFGMEFIMEIGSEEEWDCFWDEILAGWQAEPEGGVLNVSLGFWTIKNKATEY